MEFTYFDNPMSFAYISKGETACSICNCVEICFDGGGFYGTKSIAFICPRCLHDGKLIHLDISTNEVTLPDLAGMVGSEEKAAELRRVIEHCTPQLPTWQEHEWPFADGDFCRFIKIASRPDFQGPEDLFASIDPRLHFGRSADDLWEMLPTSRITCIDDGNYNTSFYLFMSGRRKVVTWDCN